MPLPLDTAYLLAVSARTGRRLAGRSSQQAEAASTQRQPGKTSYQSVSFQLCSALPTQINPSGNLVRNGRGLLRPDCHSTTICEVKQCWSRCVWTQIWLALVDSFRSETERRRIKALSATVDCRDWLHKEGGLVLSQQSIGSTNFYILLINYEKENLKWQFICDLNQS